MRIKFLGTAAAEGIPAIFCNCSTCLDAIKLGGKNIRKRSSIIIDDKIVIDFTNDILHHIEKYGVDYSRLEYLLITHSHSDHFNYYDLENKLEPYANEGNPKLNIYANQACLDVMNEFKKDLGKDESFKERFSLNLIQGFQSFMIEDYKITPLPARHSTVYKDEQCAIYVIEYKGKRMLYGLDSGYYFDSVLEYLSNHYFDLFIMDCTGGHAKYPEKTCHMNLEQNEKLVHMLKANGALDDKSIIISNHFSHNGHTVYDRDKDMFKSKGLIMSYDGMEIEV